MTRSSLSETPVTGPDPVGVFGVQPSLQADTVTLVDGPAALAVGQLRPGPQLARPSRIA